MMIAQYYQLLKEFIEIPSISIDKEHLGDIKKAAKRLKKIFEEHKMEVQFIEGYGNPIVIADYEHNKSLPTCTIYGNYDVLAANKKDGRKDDPFSLYIGKESIYGRGVADTKGQLLVHIVSIFELIKEKNLGYNIRFFIEGEKNIGSENTKRFIIENQEKLKSDFFLISDGNLVNDKGCIGVSTRGNIDISLIIKTANNQINPGTYGGIVPNAIHEACKLLSKIHGGNNQINIPYFYYDVEEIPFNTILSNKKIEFEIDKIQKELSMKTLFKEKNLDYISQIGLRPTVQITSIKSGYNDKNSRSTIQNKAIANISFKTVKKQNAEKIIKSFQQWIGSNLPDYVEYDIKVNQISQWTAIDTKNKYFGKAESFLQDIFQNEIIKLNLGMTIPVLNTITENITDNILLIPIANKDCNSQGSSENLNTKLIEKGFLFTLNFFSTQLQLF
ncbi:MAG: M20/M25/M40 family metallo-hydrolase [Candidatus Absconditicoccaceae bacterium]